MMDLEYENAKNQSADPEVSKQLKSIELELKKLTIEERKREIELELEFRKKQHELKLRHIAEDLKRKNNSKEKETVNKRMD
jgi:hypothetical protein